MVASAVKEKLAELELLNPQPNGSKQFFVSDYTIAFENATQIFFGGKLHLEHFPLWD
jgi:glutamate racemase